MGKKDPFAKFDLRDRDFLADPAPVLAQMRAAGPLVRVRLPLMGDTWMTTTDAAARKLLKDTRFRRDYQAVTGKPLTRKFWWMPGFMKPLMQNIILKDGKDHKRLRGLVDLAFARTTIDTMRPRLAEIADTLLDQINPDQPVDITATYARALPLLAICELLGVPDQDREKITRWIAPISGPTSLWMMLRALPALRRVMQHFRADFKTVVQTGRPGLIHDLVMAEQNGEKLNEDELLSMVFTLFIAGHETTVYLITNAIRSLAQDAELRARLVQDPAQISIAVEEFMRFWSPVMMTKGMYATQNLDFDGVQVAKGDQASALLLAANHDPARFDPASALIADRRPNAHLGFGHGPHVCLGIQLARAEAQIALERLLTRFPDLALTGPAPSFGRRIGMRGFSKLMVRLRP